MQSFLVTIYRLGIKELWSLVRDPIMLVLIVYTFSVSIYVAATVMPESLHKAPIAIVDEDGSPLSARIVSSFYLPHFNTPKMISLAEGDAGMDKGDYTFVLDIPPNLGECISGLILYDETIRQQKSDGTSFVQAITHSPWHANSSNLIEQPIVITKNSW